jgi:hypothetical protein
VLGRAALFLRWPPQDPRASARHQCRRFDAQLGRPSMNSSRIPPYARTVCLGALLALGIACARSEQAVTRQRLAVRAKSMFGISFPCSVRCSGPGGRAPIFGLLIGAHKDTLTWTWDAVEGRDLQPPPPGMKRTAWVESVLAYPPHLVHVGPHGTPLPFKSPAESVFIDLLWSAIGSDSVFLPPDEDKVAVLMLRDRGTTKDRALEYLYRLHSGPYAASVARMLERQRRGLPGLRLRPDAP